MNLNSKIYVAGHLGLVGSAICRELNLQGFTEVYTRTRQEMDLLDNMAVQSFFEREKPKYVFMAAAKVGGIWANNNHPVNFLLENLQIQTNILQAAHQHAVKKLIFLGSSCIYPKFAPQPLKEEYLLTGSLEPTNEWYAVAKIAGIKLCQAYQQQYNCNFISAMPTNLYGPYDNYDLKGGHVLPALIRKFHDAKLRGDSEVSCWGTGSPLREFLYSDDLARALLFLMKNYSNEQFINVGSSVEITIKNLAKLVREIIGFKGKINWNTSEPDGTPRKLMDSSRIFSLGWQPQVGLREGISLAYDDFKKNYTN
ncbi:GDP-L-fucose synthase [bacterium]|nr:GDP-L-fucose synthase [bacterium]